VTVTREQIEAAVDALLEVCPTNPSLPHPRRDAAHTVLVSLVDAVFAERDEALSLARTFQAAPDMNGQAIMEARAYLAEHMGKQTECAFFDDCIHNRGTVGAGEVRARRRHRTRGGCASRS
jgi:hypothetical protein